MRSNNQKEKNEDDKVFKDHYSHFVAPSTIRPQTPSIFNNDDYKTMNLGYRYISDEFIYEAFSTPRETATTRPFSSFFKSDDQNDKYAHFARTPLLSSLSLIFNRSCSAPPDFMQVQTLIERIDSEHPCSQSSEYKGEERTSVTPIGNHPFLKEIVTSEKIDLEEEIQGLCNGKNTCVSYSMDQEGSRFMQKRLEKATKKEMQWFLMQIKDDLNILCIDLFGNYVVQKMLELEIGSQVVDAVKKYVPTLSLHMYGCRVIQKIFDTGHGNMIIDYVRANCRSMLEDQNGNHVLQKAVEALSDSSFILNEYIKDTVKLCRHKYGCRVIQRLFEHSKDEDLVPIISTFALNISAIIDDQYGNYVLQHIIETKPTHRQVIIKAIKKLSSQKIFTLSTHKFASNVIEKCVIIDDSIDSMFLATIKERPMVVLLAADKFGNYVVQRLVDKKNNEVVIEKLREYGAELRKSVYAKHIFAKIQ